MQQHTPDEVSILIAVPLTEAEFRLRVRTSDWLSRFSDPEIATHYWRDEYVPFVLEPLKDLLKKAESLRTKVEDATLAALTRATTGSPVVVVMAHWKDSQVEFDDLSFGLVGEMFRERVSRFSSPLAQWLAAKFGEPGGLATEDILDLSLRIELPEEGKQMSMIRESPISRAARRRDELDSIFEGMIRPGNRLELVDGLHSKEAFEAAIATDFSGVLDFAACDSTILADYVSHRRRRRFGTVQAPTAIEFVATAPIVATTLELLASGPFSYQEARTHARTLWEGVACQT